jgi:hypothetical protein
MHIVHSIARLDIEVDKLIKGIQLRYYEQEPASTGGHSWTGTILEGVESGACGYDVHSYNAVPRNLEHRLGRLRRLFSKGRVHRDLGRGQLAD